MIDRNELLEWIESQWVTYASRSIPMPRKDYLARLKLDVSMTGDFRVTLGGDAVYEGDNMCQAINVFNDALKGVEA